MIYSFYILYIYYFNSIYYVKNKIKIKVKVKVKIKIEPAEVQTIHMLLLVFEIFEKFLLIIYQSFGLYNN